MRRFLFFVVVVPLAIIAVALFVANHQSVTVSLDPSGTLASGWTVALPLYVTGPLRGNAGAALHFEFLFEVIFTLWRAGRRIDGRREGQV